MKITALIIAMAFAASARAATFEPIKGQDLLTGQMKQLAPNAEKKYLVVTFLSAKCPCSNSHIEILKKLAHEHPQFDFVAVHSNTDEPVSLAKEYFSHAGLGFTVLQDEKAQLADRFRALKTPHTFVLDESGRVLYRGGVTSSNYGPGADRQYLLDAIKDIEAGQPVKMVEGRTLGCVIAR